MAWFLPLVLILAIVWGVLGILLARWLKQAGHNKPFKGKDWRANELYGGGAGHGRDVFGGAEKGQRSIALGQFGGGRVKGV